MMRRRLLWYRPVSQFDVVGAVEAASYQLLMVPTSRSHSLIIFLTQRGEKTAGRKQLAWPPASWKLNDVRWGDRSKEICPSLKSNCFNMPRQTNSYCLVTE